MRKKNGFSGGVEPPYGRAVHSPAMGYTIFAFKSLSKVEFLEAEFLLSDGQRSPAGMAGGEGSLQSNLAPPSGGAPRDGDLRSAQRLDATTGGCSGRIARSLGVIPPCPVRSQGSLVDLALGCGSFGAPATCSGSHLLYLYSCATARRDARLRFRWGGAQVEHVLP